MTFHHCYTLVALLLLVFARLGEASDDAANIRNVTILGLGGMGKAIARCFLSQGYVVNAWNRTPKNSTELDRLTLHATAQEAIAASDVIFVVINSAPKLQTVKEVLTGDNFATELLQGRTIVNMVNHDPYTGQELDELIHNHGGKHMAALMFGVPETVCSPASHLLVSSSNALDSDDAVVSSLQALGQAHEFTSTKDVGLASVVYLCLVQSLYFGLAGYELSLLIFQKYMDQTIPDDNGTIKGGVLQTYQELATNLLSTYIPAFLPIISNTINNQQWYESYVPASAVVDMFALHDIVFEKLNVFSDNYHATYVKYLQKTIDAANSHGEDGDAIGVSAVVQQYSIDEYQPRGQQPTNTSYKRKHDNEL